MLVVQSDLAEMGRSNAAPLPNSAFGFVGEGHLGFLVEDEGPDETIGVAGTGDIDVHREHAGDAALQVEDVRRGFRLCWRDFL